MHPLLYYKHICEGRGVKSDYFRPRSAESVAANSGNKPITVEKLGK